jgi:hypothetical protein
MQTVEKIFCKDMTEAEIQSKMLYATQVAFFNIANIFRAKEFEKIMTVINTFANHASAAILVAEAGDRKNLDCCLEQLQHNYFELKSIAEQIYEVSTKDKRN